MRPRADRVFLGERLPTNLPNLGRLRETKAREQEGYFTKAGGGKCPRDRPGKGRRGGDHCRKTRRTVKHVRGKGSHLQRNARPKKGASPGGGQGVATRSNPVREGTRLKNKIYLEPGKRKLDWTAQLRRANGEALTGRAKKRGSQKKIRLWEKKKSCFRATLHDQKTNKKRGVRVRREGGTREQAGGDVRMSLGGLLSDR